MALLNWSMTILGYPAHTRSGARVVGLSHMSTFAAMRFAEELGIRNGWVLADGALPQVENIRRGSPTSVSLADLIADRRVAATEGISSGRLLFAAGSTTAPRPPADRPLQAWAEAQNQPWVETVDNECSYWGNLSDIQILRLFAWLFGQRPVEGDWRKTRVDSKVGTRLLAGLFDHGWSRNLELVKPERRTQDLWSGVHRTCLLEHANRPMPSQAQHGVRLMLDFGEWSGKELTDRCPLADETGKVAPGRSSGLWGL